MVRMAIQRLTLTTPLTEDKITLMRMIGDARRTEALQHMLTEDTPIVR